MKTTLYLILLFLGIEAQLATAQCAFTEKFRNDGTLVKDYEAMELVHRDTLEVHLGLTFEGSLKSLRFEVVNSDSLLQKWPKDLVLKLSDSTILSLPMLSQTKKGNNDRKIVYYKFTQRDMGYLKLYGLIAIQYYDKDSKLKQLYIEKNQDVLIQQFNCTRQK
jgi:hypothetical protein